jgi:hypothetical protein
LLLDLSNFIVRIQNRFSKYQKKPYYCHNWWRQIVVFRPQQEWLAWYWFCKERLGCLYCIFIFEQVIVYKRRKDIGVIYQINIVQKLRHLQCYVWFLMPLMWHVVLILRSGWRQLKVGFVFSSDSWVTTIDSYFQVLLFCKFW